MHFPARTLLASCAAVAFSLVPASSNAGNVRFHAELHTVQFRSGLTLQLSEADLSDPGPSGPGAQPDGTGVVPEPGTFALLGMGLLVIGRAGHRRRR